MANKIYKDRRAKKNLQKYFKQYIYPMDIKEEFKPLLVDILMRRADLYNLSPEDIRQDVVSLLYNLEDISIGDMPEGYEKAAGLYMSEEKKILIEKSYFEKTTSQDELYQTLTHEVYHALSRDEQGIDRLGGFNSLTGQYNASLLEAIVEKSSYRAVFGNDKQNNIYFNNSARGYSDITFIIDAIEATYGVSEQEFLENAIMGRKRLAEFLNERSGEGIRGSAYQFLDELEISYSQLHNAIYPWEQEEYTPYQKSQNIISALSGIYNICERKMSERIGWANVQSYQDVSNLNDNLKYSHNKLSAIMDDRIEYFSKNYDENIKNQVNWNTQASKNKTLFKINDIENLVQAAPNFSDERNFLIAYDWAKEGRLSDLSPECRAYYGIVNNFQYKLPVTQEIVKKEFEGEKFGHQYNNLKANMLIQRIKIKENNIFRTGINKIKSFFSRKDQKLLISGENASTEYAAQNMENTTIFPTLTKEQQQYYNNQIKQAVENLNRNDTQRENGKEER